MEALEGIGRGGGVCWNGECCEVHKVSTNGAPRGIWVKESVFNTATAMPLALKTLISNEMP